MSSKASETTPLLSVAEHQSTTGPAPSRSRDLDADDAAKPPRPTDMVVLSCISLAAAVLSVAFLGAFFLVFDRQDPRDRPFYWLVLDAAATDGCLCLLAAGISGLNLVRLRLQNRPLWLAPSLVVDVFLVALLYSYTSEAWDDSYRDCTYPSRKPRCSDVAFELMVLVRVGFSFSLALAFTHFVLAARRLLHVFTAAARPVVGNDGATWTVPTGRQLSFEFTIKLRRQQEDNRRAPTSA